jgi:hypothetical protein
MTAPKLHEPNAAPGECPGAVLTDTWRNFQSTEGYVSLATANAGVIRFSGCPDRIELWVLDNPATVQFTDEQGRPLATTQIEAGVFYEPSIRAHAISARNTNAGFVARIQVVGKWMNNPRHSDFNGSHSDKTKGY